MSRRLDVHLVVELIVCHPFEEVNLRCNFSQLLRNTYIFLEPCELSGLFSTSSLITCFLELVLDFFFLLLLIVFVEPGLLVADLLQCLLICHMTRLIGLQLVKQVISAMYFVMKRGELRFFF